MVRPKMAHTFWFFYCKETMRLNTFYEVDKFTIVSSFLFDGRIIKTKPIGTRPVEELQE